MIKIRWSAKNRGRDSSRVLNNKGKATTYPRESADDEKSLKLWSSSLVASGNMAALDYPCILKFLCL